MLVPSVGAVRATTLLAPTLSLGLRFPRAAWPEIVVDPSDRAVWSVVSLTIIAHAKGDTALLRLAVRSLDSAATTPGGGQSRLLASFTAAEAHLVLHDSLRALAHLRRLVDSTYATVPITSTLSAGFDAPGIVYPRAILERANLAGALGYRDEARLWYKRFLDLWSNADGEFAPFIAGVRARYESLFPRP